jgi:hypothetical protein
MDAPVGAGKVRADDTRDASIAASISGTAGEASRLYRDFMITGRG